MRKIITQDKDKNMTTVKLIDGKDVYIGKTKVHPEDMDLASDRTGVTIAENRARLSRHEKLVKKRNKEIDLLLKQIKILEDSRDFHIVEAKTRKEFEENYLKSKETFYKRIRKNRAEGRGLNDIIESLVKAVDEFEKTQNKEG